MLLVQRRFWPLLCFVFHVEPSLVGAPPIKSSLSGNLGPRNCLRVESVKLSLAGVANTLRVALL